MIDVIQIYKSKEFFEKSTYHSANRKLFDNLNETFESKTGFVDGQKLFLPLGYPNYLDLKAVKLIIIQDIEGFNPYFNLKNQHNLDLPDWFISQRRNFINADNKPIIEFRHTETPTPFEIFKIAKSKTDGFDLSIDYTSNSSMIGIPERENHKMGVLKNGNPIRYKINGKSDFTMSGRKQRTYHEFDYVFEVVGQVDMIEYLPLNKINRIKRIPIGDCKLIDERKILK